MKSILSLIVAVIAGVFTLGGSPAPKQSAPLVAASPSPHCACNPCKCVNCECEPVANDGTPLVDVPPVADTAPTITPTEAQQVAAITEPVFTQPQPAPAPKPAVKPVAKQAAPTGHWQNVQSCGPGGCSVSRVWVPAVKPMPAAKSAPVSYGSCGPGGCSVRRGIFGRRR